MENVKILKTFIDTFYRTIQYSTLMINFRVGTIFKQYFYEYLVIQINPKILLVQLDLDTIKTEKEYKDYLVKELSSKFNLDLTFSEIFIEEIEAQGKIQGFEDNLRKAKRYSQLYDHYFGRHNKYERKQTL